MTVACGRIDFVPTPRDSGQLDDASDAGDGDAIDAETAFCGDQFALCDGFDDPLDTTRWTVEGAVTPDTTIKRRGAASLRMTMPALSAAQEAGAYVWHTGPVVTSATTLWIRAWMRITALPASTNALQLISFQQQASQGDYVFVRAADTQLYHQFDNKSASAGVAPPLDTWFCLLWRVTLATDATGSSELETDFAPTIGIASSITQGSPVLDLLGFGPFYAPTNVDVAQPGFDVWVDDVIIHTAPVTCTD